MGIGHDELLGIARHEREAVGRTIQYTPPEAWGADSPAEGWRVRDVVAHLAAAEVAAAAVLAGEQPVELDEYVKTEEEHNPTVDGFDRFAVSRRADAPLRQVIREWGAAADLFLSRASAVSDEDWSSRRVPWFAGEIPVRYLVQSRVAEWWSHGEDIRTGAGLEPRREHWPIYALNDLAVRALPWALGLAGRSYRSKSVLVELEGAGGGTWHHGLGPREVPGEGRRPDATIGGRAYQFAMVATRRLLADPLVEDGTLTVGGDVDLSLDVLRNIRVFG
ncbi:MAG TPA: maleylpyruvate isomerase family mycothiol-dependent enzyme [Actinomycetota bacterium]